MSRYPLGNDITISRTYTDSAVPPALTDASSQTITVSKPDATSQVYNATIVHDSIGKYHQVVNGLTDATQLGHYQWKSVAVVGGSNVVGFGAFDVFDPVEVALLPLQDAKDVLDIPQSTTKYDDEIYRKLATIEASLERISGGPIINRTVTSERQRVSGDYRKLALRYRPLVSVTSITDVVSGVAMSLTDLDPDYATGVLRRKLELPFWGRGPFYLVTYVAGQGVAEAESFREASAQILQYLWESQRGMSSVPQYGGEQETVTLPGLRLVLPEVAALLAPYALEVYV